MTQREGRSEGKVSCHLVEGDEADQIPEIIQSLGILYGTLAELSVQFAILMEDINERMLIQECVQLLVSGTPVEDVCSAVREAFVKIVLIPCAPTHEKNAELMQVLEPLKDPEIFTLEEFSGSVMPGQKTWDEMMKEVQDVDSVEKKTGEDWTLVLTSGFSVCHVEAQTTQIVINPNKGTGKNMGAFVTVPYPAFGRANDILKDIKARCRAIAKSNQQSERESELRAYDLFRPVASRILRIVLAEKRVPKLSEVLDFDELAWFTMK